MHQEVMDKAYFASDTTESFVRCLLRSSRGTSFRAYCLQSNNAIMLKIICNTL